MRVSSMTVMIKGITQYSGGQGHRKMSSVVNFPLMQLMQ